MIRGVSRVEPCSPRTPGNAWRMRVTPGSRTSVRRPATSVRESFVAQQVTAPRRISSLSSAAPCGALRGRVTPVPVIDITLLRIALLSDAIGDATEHDAVRAHQSSSTSAIAFRRYAQRRSRRCRPRSRPRIGLRAPTKSLPKTPAAPKLGRMTVVTPLDVDGLTAPQYRAVFDEPGVEAHWSSSRVAGGRRESASVACPCRGPRWTQRLPAFRRGAPSGNRELRLRAPSVSTRQGTSPPATVNVDRQEELWMRAGSPVWTGPARSTRCVSSMPTGGSPRAADTVMTSVDCALCGQGSSSSACCWSASFGPDGLLMEPAAQGRLA